MATKKLPEVWLRGPVENIPALLQPVAHALLQAQEELNELLKDFPDNLLWVKPAGAASTGFHLQHMSGVLDRLFSYADGQMLSNQQLTFLKAEGDPENTKTTVAKLLEDFNRQVTKTLSELQKWNDETLTEYRAVGRAQLPSTVIGLIFHAAEHTMRHLGQLIVTVKVVSSYK